MIESDLLHHVGIVQPSEEEKDKSEATHSEAHVNAQKLLELLQVGND